MTATANAVDYSWKFQTFWQPGTVNQDSLLANAKLDQGFAEQRDPETLINWPPEERRELREVAQEVWEEWAAKSDMAKKVYDSHIVYMKEQGLL